MKIFWLSAEVAPIVKVGGLGDVAGALPKSLIKKGVDIRLSLPYYGSIKTPAKLVLRNLKMSWNDKDISFNVYLAFIPGTKIPVYLIKHPIFAGPKVYPEKEGIERFSFWTKASLTLITALNFIPDIIHLHDWHAALAAQYLPEFKAEYPAVFSKVKVLYTIHNLANQGYRPKDKKNPMIEGIKSADYLNTVSPSYAKEILTKEYGAGLEKFLSAKKKRLSGILNGIDVQLFDPKTDPNLEFHYSSKKLTGKVKEKAALQKSLGLDVDNNRPLLAFIARLSWQKGVELFSFDLMDKAIKDYGAQFVFLGDGDEKYRKHLTRLARKHPHSIKTFFKLDLSLAQRLYAASDFFLVPSRFEPCGLTQMMAMRYGSLPIVRSVGGLKDTVDSSVGYRFQDYSPEALKIIILKALTDFSQRPELIAQKQRKGMMQDFSWKAAAEQYFKLYRKMVK